MPSEVELDVVTRSERIAGPLAPENAFKVRRNTVHPALRDFALTGTATALTALAAMLVISILGKTIGPIFLGEYLLVRRMASWIQGGVQLPSGVALPRFVAFSVNEPGVVRQTYFLAALLTSCVITLLLSAI